MCCKTAEHMRWHASSSNEDGLMRHPRDGEAWKTFYRTHFGFDLDPRNVRLGLATDGFSHFGTMSKQMPGNNIDVYLQPLVKELCELWNDGIETFDSSLNENFRMHAALMWTISDFPGLGILSGWNTHTGFACPTCNFDTEPCRLRHSKKWCFMGHRRFLRRNHRFRLNRVRFNGSKEERNPPLKLSGLDILRQIEERRVAELNVSGKRSRRATKQWNKRSIFFELPYWKSNLLRHNLDFMHIEKNICDNIIYTLLHDKSKSKDNINTRKDLREMGIRRDLWPDDSEKYHLAVFSLVTDNKKKLDTKKLFLTTLKNIEVPDAYSSNIFRCVDLVQKKIFGLKSHDCHIILEQLLPLAIRNVLPDHVVAVLVDFCSFCRALSSKTLNLLELDKLQERIESILCHIEILFHPSFFTVMVHLSFHLAEEAKLGGPVHHRNMYPIERELGHFKSFVRNKAQPEGSISEGYLAEESLTFCSRYIEDIEARFNRPRHVRDDPNVTEPSGRSSIFPQLGKPASASVTFLLTHIQKLQSHRYVLLNCAIVTPFVDEFRLYIRRSSRRRPSPTEIERRVNKEFVDWFQKRILNPDTIDTMSIDLKFLARGPSAHARSFTAYNINGSKFRTLAREEGLQTQNSGVFLTSKISCIASSVDGNLRQAELPYYGKLEDIIEINYNRRFKVVLFKCEREEHEPYIEASQAQLVYYTDDVVNKGWSIAVHLKPRDLYDMGEEVVEDEVYENEPYQEQELEQFFSDGDKYVQLAKDHIIDDVVEENVATNLASDTCMFE
ncbi:uncharacterized protein LOC107803711 [Nicotiana tabacum]|uniref:Uncharacterized protein LOC107803711 n=1 Tax=Nicotiana tabacum TaxID=4097 RepID=A0A1S4B210_TOBAC|nr:PREDICTED: uncharacterized protein LOC107803711 [Nicotiana tabacum]